MIAETLKDQGEEEDYKQLKSRKFNNWDKMDIFPKRYKIIKFT